MNKSKLVKMTWKHIHLNAIECSKAFCLKVAILELAILPCHVTEPSFVPIHDGDEHEFSTLFGGGVQLNAAIDCSINFIFKYII